MMREARNRKSSSNCWMRDGPGQKVTTLHNSCVLNKIEYTLDRCGYAMYTQCLLTKMFFLIATERQQGLDESEVPC